jgi:DNA-binding transcriptional ArsR family regulator
MNDKKTAQRIPVQVARSIAAELDGALYIAGWNKRETYLSSSMLELVQRIPQDWRESWPEFLGQLSGALDLLETGAFLAGVLLEGDYEKATLAIREMSAAQALERIIELSQPYGLVPDNQLDPAGRLVDLYLRLKERVYHHLGFEVSREDARFRWVAEEARILPLILRDGSQHSRFWHWLDRFYYEIYGPWRTEQEEVMRQLERRAEAALGAGGTLDLNWLPAQNPILRYAELNKAALDGKIKVVLWVEPFGLPDSLVINPGQALVSFAEPGELFANFFAASKEVARRASALGDPTRLVILRLIRNYSMVNTEIAAYLGISRPTVSVHAKILRDAGLIRSKAEGRLVRHEIVPGEIRRLFRDLENFLDLPMEK